MHLWTCKIYKKGNRRQNSGWLMLDKVCSWSNYLFNFFWFIQPDFQVGCIWVQFHPTSGSSSMRWVQNICGGLCFKRFYWHLNVSNLWRATKSQKIKRPQTRQERRSENSEYEKKMQMQKKIGPTTRFHCLFTCLKQTLVYGTCITLIIPTVGWKR